MITYGINICYAVSDVSNLNIMDLLMVSLDSVRRSSHHPSDICVYILFDGISGGIAEPYRSGLVEFGRKHGVGCIRIIDVGLMLKFVLRENYSPNGTDTGFYKYVAPYVVDKDIRTVLFLSPGSVVVHDLGIMFKERVEVMASPPDFSLYVFAGSDFGSKMTNKKNLDEGVALLDCLKMRELGTLFTAVSLVKSSNGKIKFPRMHTVIGKDLSGLVTLVPNYSSPLLYHSIFKRTEKTLESVKEAEYRCEQVFSSSIYSNSILSAVIFRFPEKDGWFMFNMPNTRDMMWDRLSGVEAFCLGSESI